MSGGMRGDRLGIVLNDAGRKQLAFVSVNEANVCNTRFSKCDIINRHGNILNQNSGIACTFH